MGKEDWTESMWLESIVETIREADWRHMATAALAVSLLLSSKEKDWDKWHGFCQNRSETETKLTYFKHLSEIDPMLVCELIRAGTKIVAKPKEAGIIIEDISTTKVDVDYLTAGALLVTIYSLYGADKFLQKVITVSDVSKKELRDRLKLAGVEPDTDTVEKLKDLFSSLVDYL